jgi:hypothetical protein
VLRIFIALLKIRRLRPGLNLRTWVSEASTLAEPLLLLCGYKDGQQNKHKMKFTSFAKF